MKFKNLFKKNYEIKIQNKEKKIAHQPRTAHYHSVRVAYRNN